MVEESEAEKTKIATRHLKWIIVLLLAIIVIMSIGIGIYWIRQNENIADSNSQTKIYHIYLNGGIAMDYGNRFDIGFECSTNSSNSITFYSYNILYNGHPATYYGSFAPQLMSWSTGVESPISSVTIPVTTMGMSYNVYFNIILPKGSDSPWVKGMNVIITIQTSTVEGSFLVHL
jgi:hypothetical protein